MSPRRPPSPPGGAGRDLPGARRAPGPTRREAVAGLRRELDGAGAGSPAAEAERLVAHALGLGRAELALAGDEPLTPEEAGRIARAAARRMAGEPLQHIEGTVEFRELVLVADPRALIPRPETEQLVERLARWARDRAPRPASREEAADERGGLVRARRPGRARAAPPLESVLDIGTGSGAIALSLVAEGIARRVVAVDISQEALSQAAENRARARLDGERVELRLAGRPVWTAVGPGERFDAIVSNPPYVSDAELPGLGPEVREHEPRVALAGGAEGLEVVREIVGRAREHLEPGGALFLEIGEGQGAKTRALLEREGWGRVALFEDLAGRDRFVQAEP